MVSVDFLNAEHARALDGGDPTQPVAQSDDAIAAILFMEAALGAQPVAQEPVAKREVIRHETPCGCDPFKGSRLNCQTGIVTCFSCGKRIARLEVVENADHPATPAPSPADQIIGLIEARFPDWKSYRDLVDCIDCTLHRLRETSATPAPVEAGQCNIRPSQTTIAKRFCAQEGEVWDETSDSQKARWMDEASAAQSAPVGGTGV